VDHNQGPSRGAQTEEEKTILALGVFRVVEKAAVGIAEYALGLLKPNAMLGTIGTVLPFVPFEPKYT